MKTLKSISKPFYAVAVLVCVGFLAVIKKGIISIKLKSQYKHISKINYCIQKLYAVVFNPYRISNGIRPQMCRVHQATAADIQKCHELFAERRRQRA